MAKILFVSERNNFTVVSLTKMLEEKGDKVIHSSFSPDELDKNGNDFRVTIIYAEDSKIEGLIYIKDRTIEDNKPIILLGDVNQKQDVMDIIPYQFIKLDFTRPFNIKEVAEKISKFVSEDASHLKKKILVVDDSGTALRNIKGWLEEKYQVILANSGTMAIKYLAMNRPDLILLDYEMPVCDGKQVLEMIRSESEFSGIPVIFLTNKNDKASVLNVSALKPDGYLLKTMEPNQIVKSIDEYFEKRKWKM
ncbi:MAG: response regulator [Lachnospiraceae bacterium]|nr:response regulator [Lachnospiraceae bacterium]